MKFRRIRTVGSEQLIPQVLLGTNWENLAVPPGFYLPALDIPPAPPSAIGLALPFQPRSFRDFMLHGQHVIDASRGLARRFLPTAYRAARLLEGITGRTFPAFKPRPLWYKQSIYYFGSHLNFVPSGTPIRSPSYSHALDYELELGFVLSKPLFNATVDEVLNDLSARDVQRAEMASGFGPQKSKHFLSSMSELAVTADELLEDVADLKASILINGKEICSTTTANMRYSIGEVLSNASKDEQLFPGELFGTGTLPGGSGVENGHWLKPGDFLQLRIDRIGEIQHQVLA